MTGRAWALFIVVAVLWGVPYLFIGVALQDGVGPLSTAALRVLSAAVVMVPLAFRRRHRSLLTGRWGRLAVVSLVEVVVPFSLIPLGEQTVSSGLAGVLIATEPMFVLAVGLVLGTRARPTLAALLGLGVGFLGVVVLLGVDGSGAGAGLLVIAAAFYGAGAVLVGRWFGDLPATPVVAGMLVLAAPVLLALALVSESLTVPSYAGIAALAALGLVTTPGGFVAFFRLIALAGPDRAAVMTYVAPVIAVSAGALVLAESIGAWTLGGTTLILVGAWLATRAPRPEPDVRNRTGAVPGGGTGPGVRRVPRGRDLGPQAGGPD